MIREIINEQMESLCIPYWFGEYGEDPPPKCYFVGEDLESPNMQEDGRTSGLFILSGWSYQGTPILSDYQRILKRRFNELRVSSDEGAVVINYSHAVFTPGDVEGVCRIEVNLNYYEWSVI